MLAGCLVKETFGLLIHLLERDADDHLGVQQVFVALWVSACCHQALMVASVGLRDLAEYRACYLQAGSEQVRRRNRG